MAPITAAQRARLPSSAFVYPAARKYPVPTRNMARRAGISESQRLAIHKAALSRAGQQRTMGSYAKVAAVVRKRSVPVTKNPARTAGKKSGTTRRAGVRRR